VRFPIRVRLTLWYVGLLAVVVAALGAFVVVRLRADLIADFDRSLRSSAAQIRRGYQRGGRFELRVSAEVLRALPGDAGSQLVTADGRVARATGRDLPPAPLISAAQRRAVLAGHDLRATAHARTDTEPFRVFATLAVRGGKRYALVVASSLEGVDAAVHRVLVLLLLAGPVVLLATAAGGWLLARKALRPVARMTAQAERIEVDRLDERVPVPRSSDEVAQLAVTLNHMLDRLHRGVEDKRRLVADASHELRTPLAVMRAELDVALAYDDLQPEAARVLTSTREEVERMTRTVENLLTLARVDEGRLELLRRPFELREIVDDVAAELGALADRRIDVAAGGDRAIVDADRDRVRQVVANLVDNAVKYSRAGGRVRVITWRDDGEAGVSVADAGAGIPARALPYVFDRFYRADGGRAGGGSGLGLAICREIVVAHGGRIWAESEEGRGSRFSLALPAQS
jgi:two-component system OmpR family sensor kinase